MSLVGIIPKVQHMGIKCPFYDYVGAVENISLAEEIYKHLMA